ncbi:MAG: crotonase/enoyl-CoA hydratase family protein [Acidimicrobiales bacterium]
MSKQGHDEAPVGETREGGVVVVTIDRPAARNAVDRATASELAEVFRRFDDDDSASVAVLTGSGGTFCAGADLKAISSGGGNSVSEDGDGPMGPTRMRLSKPVIAAVSGHAVAGGLELALWCDLRVVDETAVFGVFCRRFGVPLVDGGSVRLPRLIGLSRALDLILTGRPVGAEEALAIGLANRLTPPGEPALAGALALAHDLESLPQVCLRSDRMSAIEQEGMEEGEALGNEYQRGLLPLRSGESLAGAERFAAGAGRHGDAPVT